MAAEMAIGQTKKQATMAGVLPAEEWKNFNNMTSDAQGFIQLGFHAMCAAVPMVLIHQARQSGSILQLMIAEVMLGFVASFYFAGFHEIIHMTAFRSKWVQKVLSYPIGFAVFRGPNWFWCFHWFHHRYTQDPELDPEISGGSSDLMDPSKSVFAYCRFMSGWPFGFERVLKMAKGGMCSDNWVKASGMQTPVLLESIVFVTLYAALSIGACIEPQIREVVFWYWLLPHMLGAGHLRYYQFCEHRGCEFGHHQALDAWGSCRTTTTGAFYARLAWNMPFHIEHHSWPAVPFYLLPSLNDRIKDTQPKPRALFSGERGYFAVHTEFLRRVLNGEPTSIPKIEYEEDEQSKTAAVDLKERRDEMLKVAAECGSFDMSEVSKHNSANNCWIVIDGMVIDATTFIPEHPGGEMVLAEKAGRDASRLFKMVHPEGTLERRLPERCLIGILDSGTATKNGSAENATAIDAKKPSNSLKEPLLSNGDDA